MEAGRERRIVIGQRIAVRRKKLELIREELAEKGETTRRFVSYAESGKMLIGA